MGFRCPPFSMFQNFDTNLAFQLLAAEVSNVIPVKIMPKFSKLQKTWDEIANPVLCDSDIHLFRLLDFQNFGWINLWVSFRKFPTKNQHVRFLQRSRDGSNFRAWLECCMCWVPSLSLGFSPNGVFLARAHVRSSAWSKSMVGS